MALLPKPLPAWMEHVCRGDSIAWDKAKRQGRFVLVEWAKAGEPHTYTELTEPVTAIDWPEGAHTEEGSQLGYLLGQVCVDELRSGEDRPLLSAMVIDKTQNLPSSGFWDLCTDLGVPVGSSKDARMMFWLAEVAACGQVCGKEVR